MCHLEQLSHQNCPRRPKFRIRKCDAHNNQFQSYIGTAGEAESEKFKSESRWPMAGNQKWICREIRKSWRTTISSSEWQKRLDIGKKLIPKWIRDRVSCCLNTGKSEFHFQRALIWDRDEDNRGKHIVWQCEVFWRNTSILPTRPRRWSPIGMKMTERSSRFNGAKFSEGERPYSTNASEEMIFNYKGDSCVSELI